MVAWAVSHRAVADSPSPDVRPPDVRSPNVVLIVADDLCPGDLAMGADAPNCAPNLAAFARQSVCFDRAYSGSPVCAPARAALLTGRYPHRTGAVTLNMERYPALVRLHPREQTIANDFRRGGYHTGMVGKWHLGRTDGHLPHQRGFDDAAVFRGVDQSYRRYRWSLNGEVGDWQSKYLTVAINDRAVGFVRRNRDRPFFLHLAHYAPHRPLDAYQKEIEPFLRRGYDANTATIYAMIKIMDRGLGRLFDELERLKLERDTIVIFTSDNGPDPIPGPRSNPPHRGTKYTVNEGGIRVPLMIRRIGHYAPGHRRSPVHFVDMLPTLLDLCRLPKPATSANDRSVDDGPADDRPPIDGQSFAALLTDGRDDFAQPRFWQWNRVTPDYAHNAAFGDGRYKLVRPFVTRNHIKDAAGLPPRLYDIIDDPGERHDIASEHPDRVRQMNAQLERWAVDVESDRIGREARDD